MDREKCAFDKGKHCKALTKKACEGCTFYKTVAELQRGREKADARIQSLPYVQRIAILSKYGSLRNPESLNADAGRNVQ